MGTAYWLRFEDRILDVIVLSREAELPLLPQAVYHREPLGRPRVARVVGVEFNAILPRFLRPPRRHDVERQPSARDVIDIRSLFGDQRRGMKRRPHRDHQLESVRDAGQARRAGPSLEHWRFWAP